MVAYLERGHAVQDELYGVWSEVEDLKNENARLRAQLAVGGSTGGMACAASAVSAAPPPRPLAQGIEPESVRQGGVSLSGASAAVLSAAAAKRVDMPH